MLTVTCDKCGVPNKIDEARVPPSGIVLKCPACSQSMVVRPPKDPALELSFDGLSAEAEPLGGPSPGLEVADLPAPKRAAGPTVPPLSGDEPDLPAPKRAAGSTVPPPSDDGADLPAPVGPVPTKALPDLPAPVGPVPTRALPDLPAPVGPVPTKGIDLPAPVGPVPTKGIDLPTPVGPVPTKALPDLPAPVGPVPTRALPDLPAPVGPVPTKGIDLPTPVGPVTTRPIDLPAPKGFFDDVPPPAHAAATGGSAAAVTPSMALDELDLVPPSPAGPPSLSLDPPRLATPPSPPPIAPPAFDLLGEEPPAAPPPGAPALEIDLFAPAPSRPGPTPAPASPPPLAPATPTLEAPTLDNLDLLPAGDTAPASPGTPGGMAFGEVDLGAGDHPNEPVAGVVSFGRPSAAAQEAAAHEAATPPVRGDDGALDLGADLPKKKPKGTIADEGTAVPVARTAGAEDRDASPVAAAPPQRRSELAPGVIRRRRILLGTAALAIAALGAGGWLLLRIQAEKERQETIRHGVAETKKLALVDDTGHWLSTIAAARKVLAIDPKNADAHGLRAQAIFALVLDEGRDEKKHVSEGDAALNEANRQGAHGPEIVKAQALREILDGKPEDALALLGRLGRQVRGDANLHLYRGWAALAAAKWPEARDAFQAALQLAPNRIPALYGLGRARLMIPSERDKAKEALEAVLQRRAGHVGARLGMVELLPPDRDGTREQRLREILESKEAKDANPRDLARAWALYGDEALRFRRLDLAMDRYNSALKFDKANVGALAGGGLAALERGKIEDARQRLKAALANDDRHVVALVAMTRVSLLDGKISEASQLIERALRVNPADANVQLWYGHVRAAENTPESLAAAEKAFREAIKLDPHQYDSHVALSRLLASQGRSADAVQVLQPVEQAAKADAALANVLGAAYLGSDPARAETWFRTALALDGASVDARANLASALEKQDKMEAAIAEYIAARKLDPSREDVALRLAAAYEKARRPADAEKLFAELLAATPSVTTRAAAGRFFARREQFARAAEQAEPILSSDPRNAAGLFLRGMGELLADKLTEAQESVSDALAIDPQPQYFDGLGRIFEKQKILDDAAKAYTQAIERDPVYVAPRVGRARVKMLRREWREALAELREVLALEPGHAEANLGMGKCIYNLGGTAKARRKAEPFLKKAIAADPKLAEAYFLLGQIAYDADDRRGAVANLRRFTDLVDDDDPLLPDALRNLGEAQDKSGQRAEACRSWRRYIDVAPKNANFYGDIKKRLYSCP